MDEHGALGTPEERLRRFGRQPVDPGVQGRHLSEMALAAGTPAAARRWWLRSRLATGVVAAFLVGGSGLAYAASQGSLPGPVQDAVHAAASPVGIDVPKADEASGQDDHGVARSTEGCEGQDVKNHGQFVRSSDDKHAAAQSDCGKPVPTTLFANPNPSTSAGAANAGGDCEGPPPWAHHALTGTAKTQAQAAWQAQCGDDDEVTPTATTAAPHATVVPGQSNEDHGTADEDHGDAGVNGNGAANGEAGDDHGKADDDHGTTTVAPSVTQPTTTVAPAAGEDDDHEGTDDGGASSRSNVHSNSDRSGGGGGADDKGSGS